MEKQPTYSPEVIARRYARDAAPLGTAALRKANEILRLAIAFFAQAERGRHFKP